MQRSLIMALASMMMLASLGTAAQNSSGKVRFAIVGLEHDHVWGILKDLAEVPQAQLVAIADPHPELIEKAKGRVPAGVKFYSNYITMLDQVKPQAVITTTATYLHYPVAKACALRHINVEMEKPMATTAADARAMERLAKANHIKLMVNYFDNWLPSFQQLHADVKDGKIGPVQQLISQNGHQGPREIGASKWANAWLYDPVKDGGGALMDFACYGAALSVWMKGRPTKVFARSLKLKISQHNKVEDDAVVVLEYPNGTAILEPSWDWPFSMERIQVFGPGGSLMALSNALLYRAANTRPSTTEGDGEPVALPSPPQTQTNPIAYLVDCIQHDKPVEGMLSGRLNVTVNEILDAAKESIRTGRAIPMPAE